MIGGSCHKYNFLSRQTFCRGKHVIVATKDVFSRDKQGHKVFVATKMRLVAAPANNSQKASNVRQHLKKKETNCLPCSAFPESSPWYNRHGWVGIKKPYYLSPEQSSLTSPSQLNGRRNLSFICLRRHGLDVTFTVEWALKTCHYLSPEESPWYKCHGRVGVIFYLFLFIRLP